jgi:ABC-type dipeptide/oligopeptide/nickel transport system ATPase subunit
MNSSFLEVKNLSFSVKGKTDDISILKDISFKLEKEKTLGIAGESGSGKTTLGKLLAGILRPVAGEIIFNHNIKQDNKKIHPVQILFQNNGEILNPFRKVSDMVDEAVRLRSGKKEMVNIRNDLFRSLNFAEDLWGRKGSELSGGEQQRAALARLLAAEPELLILDEPFSAQDPESQLNLLNLFLKIKNEFNITLICIAHNLRILRKLCDEIIIIYRGRQVEKGNTEDIFNSPKHPYTKFLINSEDYNLSYDELKSVF